jgi:serine/threonine protein kinase
MSLDDPKPRDPFALTLLHQQPRESETASPSASSPTPGYRQGDLLSGRYQLIRTLEERRRATVWVVQDVALDVQLTLKMIPHADGDPHSAERMLSEARAVAHIEHPAIVRVLDFGLTDRNDPFVVTDLVSGVSVRDQIDQERRVPPIDAVRWLLPIADGLSVAHSLGVILGGIRPEAIVFVSEGGGRYQPKLIDFGTADENAPSPLDYPSPEQANSHIGYETDVRSFCAVLYEMMTGAKPFFRAGDGDADRHAVEAELAPTISSFGIDDPELSSVLVRGLRSSSADGFSDMHSLGVALARWLLRQGVQEDVTTQSLRAVWLEAGSSTPPTALDVREGAARSIAAALGERVVLPKRSALRPVLGIAAGVLTLGLLGVAGVYTARAGLHREPPPAATRSLSSPPPEAPTPQYEAARLVRSEPALAASSVPAPLLAQPTAAVPKATHERRSRPPPRAPSGSMHSAPAFPDYEWSPHVKLPSGEDGYVAPKLQAGAPPPAAENPYIIDAPARPPAPSENPYGEEGQ